LQLKDIKQAEQVLFIQSQKRTFSVEIALLVAKKELPRKNCLNDGQPYLDEVGLLRVGGRLENLRVTSIHKHPIILHGKDLMMHRLITNIHLDNGHIRSTTVL